MKRNWRLNERHYGALQGLDKTATRDKYGDEQFMLWRRSYDTPPPELADDAALYSSEHVELVEQADMHYWEDELDEAVTLYSQLREKVEGDDLAAAVDRRLAVAKIEQALQRDEWFDIVFDEQLSGFLRLSGAWRRVDDRTISGKVALSIGPDEEMLLVSEAYTRNQWEMKATIDMSRMEGAEWLGAAILAHYSDIAPDWRSIHFQPTLKSVSAVRRFFKEAKSPAELDLARPFDVHVKVWEDQVVVAVNGDRVYAGPFLGFEPKSVGNQFGFGARASAIRRGELHISNIAIRGLFEAPAELVQPGF